MTSQLFSVNLSSKANVVSSSNEWRLVSYSPCKSSSRVFRFPVLPRATIAISTTQGNDFLLVKPQLVISSEGDVRKRIHNLKENTRRALMTASNPAMKLKLVDMIQRLGLGYIFEEDIKIMLETLAHGQPDDDLYTVALRFRILRHNGLHPNPDVFGAFMDANGKFGESLVEDTEGLLSLYEASYLGANGEDILSQAKEFTTTHLKKSVSRFTHKLGEQILESFEIPRHLRMVRLEARRYIEEYGKDIDHTPVFLQLAKLEYNQVQSLHQMELAELSRWWRDLGLASKLTFARDRPIECFLWSVGLLPEPKYSTVRIELAKTVSILLVIDDVFDTYGTYDDLVLFTKAIQRWDVDEIEQLPEYMKICYMALHNTTNEICDVVHKNHGLSVLPYLRKAWIDTIQAFMVEAEWVKRGYEPDLKDYIDNGITTAGTYMALVHLFFLMGEGVTPKNMSSLLHSYPPFFTHAGKILRLWDDLGTSKEEQERGDIASSVQLLMKEKNIKSEEDGRKQILELIQTSWKELNEALVAPNIFPFSIVNVALNMSRASQVVYQHDDGNSYFSSVDDHARSLFFTPIDM
ncbi:putative geranyl diphosphate diphosphatase [Helianthus annuus]|nr:putative geranyl diphosphate diphosphatase [Helianthus annuus]